MKASASVIRNTLLGTLFVLATMLTSACASSPPPQMLEPSERSPAATGTVEVEQDANNNHRVSVQVDHLAPPQSLDDQASTYVLWISPRGSDLYYNQGQLQINDERSASIEATTPFTEFDVIVTAEPRGDVLDPSEQVVLRATIEEGRTRPGDEE